MWKRRSIPETCLEEINLLGFGEHAGSGVPEIYNVWEAAGYVPPIIEEHFGEDGPTKTVIVLPLIEKEALGISEKSPEKSPEKAKGKSDEIRERMDKAVELIIANPSISRAQLAEALNITVDQVRTVIKKLKESGKIHRSGSDKKGEWIVD